MSAAVSLDCALAADPSPPRPYIVHDRSGDYRAVVTGHAIQRFADRVLGLNDLLAELDDR